MITITINVDGQPAQDIAVTTPPSTEGLPPQKRAAWLKALDFALTARESDVLRLVATGMQYRQVALVLNVSERTIRTHMNNIYARTGLQNNTMLVTWAWLTGIINEQDIIQAWRDIAPYLVDEVVSPE